MLRRVIKCRQLPSYMAVGMPRMLMTLYTLQGHMHGHRMSSVVCMPAAACISATRMHASQSAAVVLLICNGRLPCLLKAVCYALPGDSWLYITACSFI